MQSSVDVNRLGAGLPERVAARIQLLLGATPNPEAATRFLERLRQESASAFDRITSSPAALRCAINVFSYSQFLSESLLQNPERILQVANSGSFYRVLSAEEYRERLQVFLGDGERELSVDLARFRRRQLLRILLRDVMAVAELSDVTAELSSLADAILDVSYRRIRAEFVERHGEPRLANGEICGFSVISLGKLGGRELNYSSDIDLMFVYGGAGETGGPSRISNKEFYKNVANRYTALLSTYTAEGQCYRVDLRLRPDGTLGEICVSLEGARSYYNERARDWEKQMLIKARVSAGDPGPGAALLEFAEPLIYQSSLDFRAVEAVSETRQRIGEKVAARKRTRRGLDVKLAPGGVRDIEFLVQCLQRLYGGRDPWVRHGGTMLALFRLRDKGLLSGTEYARLATAYQFLRYVEHRLQMDEDRQVHALPSNERAMDLLARKMPVDSTGSAMTGEELSRRIEEHLAAVLEIYDRVIHAGAPELAYQTTDVNHREAGSATQTGDAETADWVPQDSLERLAEQRIPGSMEVLARARLKRGRERFTRFLEEANTDVLNRMNADGKLTSDILDIFENSTYFGEELLRFPELAGEIEDAGEIGLPQDSQDATALGDLRRYYRRQMLRIQSESMLRRAPIFGTLKRTSALADSVIAAAYQMALRGGRPASAEYVPKDQMMVIALGRLGMSEFDLGSDADLVFVIPDKDSGEQPFWTGVAERMIQAVSSYTGEGMMFAVDTRLRPNGREGDLVQPEGAYKSYFADQAEAWEGITYMKSRAVTGNIERATAFLHELQEVDWRRYGQSMRSRKELAAMRAKLEREQGSRNPLKAGPGGYYDIDFALMYLRLRGAGIFYKVLNTPERIDVIEKMGHLDREDADFLRDSATFFRALDHGQRISTGHAEGSLPASAAQLEVLTSLVQRWTPALLHEQSLDVTLAEIRKRTREFFDRLFGR